MHYCVLVIHPDSMPVDDVLAPYDANLAVCRSEEDEDCWYNPKGKWDWYKIGGRWEGALKLRNGKNVDSALVKDVDTSFDMDRYNLVLQYWDNVMSDTITPVYEPKHILLQNYISRENYAALQAMFHFTYVIDHKGEWHQLWDEHWSATLPHRIEWAQTFWDNFIYPVINSSEPYRLTVVDIHM